MDALVSGRGGRQAHSWRQAAMPHSPTKPPSHEVWCTAAFTQYGIQTAFSLTEEGSP